MFHSNLQLVFEKAHVGHSIVDLRQQSFHILYCNAGIGTKEKKEKPYSSAVNLNSAHEKIIQFVQSESHGGKYHTVTYATSEINKRLQKEAGKESRSALLGSFRFNDRYHYWSQTCHLPPLSLQLLLLFSQETGSCPLPASHHITSSSLSGGGRLFVLELLPPKQKPGFKIVCVIFASEHGGVWAGPWQSLSDEIWI